jgi:tetratricopeptide (TPR) repeat protein
MAVERRRTALLDIRYPGPAAEMIPLDVQRPYPFVLSVDGRQAAGGVFESPLGDEGWRNVCAAMREATEGGSGQDGLRRQAETIKDSGRRLFRHLGELGPELQAFLAAEEPRRLVVQSARPEIHLLPWEAMVDSKWRSVADTDLSVVHSIDVFDERPVLPTVPLRVQGVFGPGTEKRTLAALEELAERTARRGGGRILVTRNGLPAAGAELAQVVQVEAHGDAETGELDLEAGDPFATSLADGLRGRSMLLLWSCFSALVHSWGESLSLKLHRQQNTFVLGFATPLRFDTSGELASRFYGAVFGDRTLVDPETAVVRERARLFKDRVRACEWAAMTLWLRAPLDLGEAALQGPRFLEASERPPLSAGDRKVLETAVQQAVPGRTVVVKRLALPGRLPEDVFGNVRGAVVHLRADADDDGGASALQMLGAASASAHRGDRVLALLDALARQPGSLLVWSGISVREAQALVLPGGLPSSVAIVLVSPWELPTSTSGASLDGGQDHEAPRPRGWIDEVSDVEQLVEAADHNADVLERADRIERRGGLTDGQRSRLFAAAYWVAARLGQDERAEELVRRVSAVDPCNGRWLRGNLLRRHGLYAQARMEFERAIAEAGGDPVERARAQIELAGIAVETADRSLAESLYREAIATLEGVSDRLDDPRWSSALGRSLRDLGALYAEDESRFAECETLARRALVIHCLDGRFGQVGSALKTRGILERARGRWDQSEAAFAAAATSCDRSRNLAGWAAGVAELSELAFRMGHYERALVLIRRARTRLDVSPLSGAPMLGRLAALEARVQWRLGALEEVRTACAEALRLLSLDRARERASIGELGGLVDSLLYADRLPRGPQDLVR